MRKLIETEFPHCITNGCIEEETAVCIIIHDDNTKNRSCIYKSADPLDYPKFTVTNPNGKTISFLAIDNCILFAADGGKCDFAVFDEKKYVFVEIKKGGGSDENRSNKKADAVGQLRSTLDKFSSVNFDKYRVMACISVGYFNQSPAAAASDLDLLVEFINDYNVELIEGNELSFP